MDSILEMSQSWPLFFQFFQQFKGKEWPSLKLETKIGVVIFSLGTIFAQYSSSTEEQVINLRKVKTESLKFRTDLQDQGMDGCSEIQ